MDKKKIDNENPEEEKIFVSLRADDWESFIGQEDTVIWSDLYRTVIYPDVTSECH